MKKLLFYILFSLGMMSFANVNYNVFVKLDDNASKNVSLISKDLERVGIESLYSQGYVVHLTLYLTEYKADKLDQIKSVVNEIASKSHPFEIEFKKVFKTGGNWLMLDNDKNVTLQALSDEVTHLLSPIRATDAVVPAWAKNIPAKAASFEKYGSPNVFSNFDPHVTLVVGKFGDVAQKGQLEALLAINKFTPFKSKVIGMGIAEVDGSGQAKKDKVLHYVEFK